MTNRILAMAVFAFAFAMPAAAQSSSSAPHTGGFSPFRGRDYAGTEFDARTLEQEGCPLEVSVTNVGRDERGVTLTVRVANPGAEPVARHVIAVWVLASDGTVRGSQQSKQSKALAAGESRHQDVTLRTIRVQAGDTLVAAVQETAGATPWRKDAKALEAEVKAALGR